MQPLLDTLWVQFGIVLALSVGAHCAIAYVLAPKRAVHNVEAWFSSERGRDVIMAHAVPHIKTAIGEWTRDPETGKFFTAAFGSYFTSQEGQQLLGAMAGATGKTVESLLTQRFAAADGTATKDGGRSLEDALVSSVDFENPLLNGAWALVPKTTKRRIFTKMFRAFKQGNAGMLIAGDSAHEGAIDVDSRPAPTYS